ncbi:hypothetical protein [Streptomyces sp. NPDC090021]|uniref:hypothetical protein n=1 Tax=Streptomyces sp. NPDC090021 TaxID=3365919 RepID=UPI00380CDE30
MIAHRLSTVMDADRVIATADGRVVQQGPPAEPLADPAGLFHTLVRRQLRRPVATGRGHVCSARTKERRSSAMARRCQQGAS